MSQYLSPQSIYYDLADEASFGVLEQLLTKVKIDPAPDVNFTVYDETNCPTSVLSLCLQHAHQQSAQNCFLALVDQGAQIDSLSSWKGEYGSWSGNQRVRPTYHLLEFCAHLNIDPITQLMIDKLPSERMQQIIDTTNVFNIACSYNNTLLVQHILKNHHIDINANPRKRSVIGQLDHHNNEHFYVCSAKTIPMLSMLIKHGANFMAKNDKGQSAFEVYNLTQPSKECFALATETAMAQCLKNSSKSDFVLDPALTQALFTSITQREKDNTSVLIKSVGSKALKNIKNKEQQNLLFPALQGRNFALVKRLMDLGVDLHAFDALGHCPLTQFLTLPYSRWGGNERDRSGERRALLRKEVFQHARWDAKDPQGRTLAWLLWITPLDDHGMHQRAPEPLNQSLMHVQNLIAQNHPKTPSGMPDFFVTTTDGTTMFAEMFKKITSTDNDTVGPKALSNTSNWHPHNVLQSIIKDARFSPPHARALLVALFHDKSNIFWDNTTASNRLNSTTPIYSGRLKETETQNQPKFIALFDTIWQKMIQDPSTLVDLPPLVSHLKVYTQLSSHVEKYYLESTTHHAPSVTRKAKML